MQRFVQTPKDFTVHNNVDCGIEVDIDGNSIKVTNCPGSIWGDFGKSNPAANTVLLRNEVSTKDQVATRFVTAVIGSGAKFVNRGEQCGIILTTIDEQNQQQMSTLSWIKCVLERTGSGKIKLLIAKSTDGIPQVIHQIAFDEDPALRECIDLNTGTMLVSTQILFIFNNDTIKIYSTIGGTNTTQQDSIQYNNLTLYHVFTLESGLGQILNDNTITKPIVTPALIAHGGNGENQVVFNMIETGIVN